MKIEGWDINQIRDWAEAATRPKLKEVAEIIAANVRLHAPVGTISRPMYVRGPNKNKPWTSRDNGRLKRSIRVTMRKGGGLNVRVYAGDNVRTPQQIEYLAYYTKIVEYSRPFFRPAWRASYSIVREKLGMK